MDKTVIHSPVQGADQSSSLMNTLLTVIFMTVVLFLIVYYAVPALMQSTGWGAGTSTNTPNISVPDKVDVNLNQTPK